MSTDPDYTTTFRLELTRIQQTLQEKKDPKAAEQIQELALQMLAKDIRSPIPKTFRMSSLEERQSCIIESLTHVSPGRKKELTELTSKREPSLGSMPISGSIEQLTSRRASLELQRKSYQVELKRLSLGDPKRGDFEKMLSFLGQVSKTMGQKLPSPLKSIQRAVPVERVRLSDLVDFSSSGEPSPIALNPPSSLEDIVRAISIENFQLAELTNFPSQLNTSRESSLEESSAAKMPEKYLEVQSQRIVTLPLSDGSVPMLTDISSPDVSDKEVAFDFEGSELMKDLASLSFRIGALFQKEAFETLFQRVESLSGVLTSKISTFPSERE